jgi:type I restriction enzyme S subunit
MRVKLDKVCKRIYAGGDVPKGRYSTVKTAEYAIPIYANAEKDNGLYGYTDTARENELSITVAARGTIGFTAIRREPFLPVVRLITVVPDLSTVSERYLYYALRNCKPAFSGTSIPQLTVPDIKKNEIELYSLSVQETIADKLDAVGRIIELRQQQLQKLDDLVKARFVEMFGDPLLDDGRYCKAPLGCLAQVGSSKRIFEKEYVSEGIPFYRTKEIVELSNGNKISTELFITPKRYNEIRDEYGVPQAGDLLISAVGTIGVIWIVDGKNDFYFKDGNLLRVANSDNFMPVYLKCLLETLICAHKSKMSSGTAYAALTISTLKEMSVYKVPLAEQSQFSTFVSQVDKSKVAVQKSLDEAQLLFDSLMQQYFG